MVRTQLAAILAVCLFILVKIFLIREKKNIWFGLGGFLLVRKGFSKAARVTYFCRHVFKNKNSMII